MGDTVGVNQEVAAAPRYNASVAGEVRVRSAMKAQTELEGRFLGGRPPYGYRLADAGPHPTPARQPRANGSTSSNPTR
jgi:hypothetical protein